jgi:hypothetical protein
VADDDDEEEGEGGDESISNVLTRDERRNLTATERAYWRALQADLTTRRREFHGAVTYAFDGIFSWQMYGSAEAVDEMRKREQRLHEAREEEAEARRQQADAELALRQERERQRRQREKDRIRRQQQEQQRVALHEQRQQEEEEQAREVETRVRRQVEER